MSDSLVHRSFHVSSPLDVVAAEVILNGKSITFISLYIPPGDDNFKIDDLRQLFNDVSVQGPFILLGDVNAHHSSWGSLHETRRGSEIESLLTELNLVCLNDGSPTYLSASYQTSSAIDIAVVSPCLATWFQFMVDDDPHFSDHFPIKLHLTFNQITLPPPSIPSWSLKHADWDKFREAVNENAENMTTPEITTLLNNISEAAERSIPISRPTRRKTSTPWWTQECAHAVAKRKRALRNYQKFITAETRLEYLVASRHCRAVSCVY